MNDIERSNGWRPALRRAGRLAAGGALVALGIAWGSSGPPSGEALGQSRTLAPQDHMRSGGQLAIPVLERILGTLERMDGRLARLETAAKQWQPAGASRAPVRQE